MFKLQPNPTFRAKVPISVPGQEKPQPLEMEFRHMSREAMKDYFESLPGQSDAEALARIVVGWSGVDHAYSADALAVLLDNYPSAAASIFDTYRNELFEARRKN